MEYIPALKNCGTNLDHGVLIVGYGYDLFLIWTTGLSKKWVMNGGKNGYIQVKKKY